MRKRILKKNESRSQKKDRVPRLMAFARRMFILNGKPASDRGTMDYWRDQLFCVLGLFIIFLTGPLFVYGAYLYASLDKTAWGLIQFFSYVTLVVILLMKRVSVSIRAFVVLTILYIYCVFLLVTTASTGAGLLSVLVILVLSGALLRNKPLVLFVSINLLIFVVITVLLYTGVFDDTLMAAYRDTWPIVALTTQVNGIGLLFLSHIIYSGLENQTHITQQQKAKLAESERRYRTIFNQTAMGIFYTDKSYHLADANIQCRELLNIPLHHIRRKRLADIVHPDDYENLIIALEKTANKNSKMMSGRTRLVSSSSDVIDIFYNATVAQTSKDKPGNTVWVFEDITEKIALEQKNIQIEAHLQNQQRLEAIGTLSSGVAHEINNPITGILNYGQLILDSQVKDDDVREYAGEIIYETQRISEIVKTLLQFSRHEQQVFSLDTAEEVISRTLMLIKTILRNDQIHLEVHVKQNLPKLRCHRQKIQQVLINLIINAKDALNARYPDTHPNKTIILSADTIELSKKPHIRITVEDHGSGIPESIQDKVFNPFFSTKPKETGTGLGLYLCYGIVKEHGGHIHFDTEQNAFTRFYIDLPAEPEDEEP